MNQPTEILPIDEPRALALAAKLVRSGKMIAFPTDTVYGIGTCAFQRKAIEKIYQIKTRSHQKAIPILLADLEDLRDITPPLYPSADRLAERFWPGALTVLPLLPSLPDNISPSPTVGVRIPDHDPARALLRVTGPLAATSANLSGEPPALTADQVRDSLGDRVHLILDGGDAPGGVSSTVVDCCGEEPLLLRKGPLIWREIADFLDLPA